MTDEYLEGIMRKTTNDNEPAPQCRELGGCVAPEMCQELGRCTSTTPHSELQRWASSLKDCWNAETRLAEFAESRLKEAEERAKANQEIVAAALALVPHLEEGWDEQDGKDDVEAAEAAVQRLIDAAHAKRKERKAR